MIELRLEAEEIAKTAKFPVKVIGYSDEIEKLMQSANVMVSKLGGLTTFEALACRLPIIADATTPPMPQEAGTVNLLAKRGAGILLKKSIRHRAVDPKSANRFEQICRIESRHRGFGNSQFNSEILLKKLPRFCRKKKKPPNRKPLPPEIFAVS